MPHFEGKTGYGCSCPDGTCDMNCRMYRLAESKPSNADRIRAMTDEELTKWICDILDDDCFEEWLDWLRKETEKGE